MFLLKSQSNCWKFHTCKSLRIVIRIVVLRQLEDGVRNGALLGSTFVPCLAFCTGWLQMTFLEDGTKINLHLTPKNLKSLLFHYEIDSIVQLEWQKKLANPMKIGLFWDGIRYLKSAATLLTKTLILKFNQEFLRRYLHHCS